MKFKTLLWTMALSFLLCGCGKSSPPAPTVAEEHAGLPTTAPADPAQLEGAALTAYGEVLESSRKMYYAEGEDPVPVSRISQLFTPEDMPWTIVQIAVLDLHGDGIPEAILEISNSIGYVVLGYQENGHVLAQGIWHRAFQDLKSDGSYMGSGSSFDHAYYRQTLSDEIILAECYEDMDGTRHYWVDGKEVEEAVFLAFEAEQQAKANVAWYGDWQEYLASR